MRNDKGFSLIEIMVAVTIIALLTVGAVLSFGSSRVRSRETARIQAVSQIATAIDSYVALGNDYFRVNPAVSVNGGLLQPLIANGLLKTIPSDPQPGGGSSPVICTDYEYQSPWDATGTYFSGQIIGKREYYVAFGSELAAASTPNQNVHPLNKNVYGSSTLANCTSKRGVGILFGPVQL